ncbi:cytochrome c oxidase subunit I [Streptomyces stelliscabiei]|uniref:cytochrome c oxidase subunit I n=1 Tax=Streptomyces stelliscabiei TaxID=146820 RepID=UPI0029B58A51|nr:cbb3-type cytochrome c oxidase subunit I [Streptomyces stelliscabiei]MDX2550740.1 cbb3-type cytochrome c oxidase subunit I [Streptomyces stelliscabiei]MDX2616877.1 cbb3-type cytochrome c oxidase subunit I [Streptomyces stelliscabiei]MDX2635873.1 cbb3-type cytochrome c oxidase subunit I [Streptomyces stelliscabiei]MDX2665625.1 cbb3-type cytochrome c oxidase subunit I [Streptomyces stelliscabiei]MDX2718147.1 cbb3-type cytochrome c oxidase subunit I [Streptomyces stelliscabiei]
MATDVTEPVSPVPAVERRGKGQVVVSWPATTDHKKIGHLYLITSFAFFPIGGLLAMAVQAELARPGLRFLSAEQYNQSFRMHGAIMLLLFATPTFACFANAIMSLQIGAPDVAFPRLDMLSYWLFLLGGLIVLSSFFTTQGAADFGWTAYTPLSGGERTPYVGGDMWIMGLALAGFGTILGAVNLISTIICMRAPGMTMFRLPIFTRNVPLTSVLVLLAFPVLAAALLVLEADRKLGAQVFDPENGGAIPWKHLFWFFGHPEVCILALPFFSLGAEGMPRRYADYLAADGFTALNTLSSIGAFLFGLSTLPFLYNVWKTAKIGEKVDVDDPWGYGRSLEWATSCPPTRHNFITLPRVRSESPAFDLHHPHIAKQEHAANVGRRDVIEAEGHPGDRS